MLREEAECLKRSYSAGGDGEWSKPEDGEDITEGIARESHDEMLALAEELEAHGQWQPMDTAPKTGVGILLLQPWRSGHDVVLIGHYANGWVNRDCEALQPKPTGWMPCPDSPKGYPYTTHKPDPLTDSHHGV